MQKLGQQLKSEFPFLRLFVATVVALGAFGPVWAIAQTAGDPGQGAMGRDATVSALMYFTLLATLGVAVAAFAFFLRRRSNREATRRGFDLDQGRE